MPYSHPFISIPLPKTPNPIPIPIPLEKCENFLCNFHNENEMPRILTHTHQVALATLPFRWPKSLIFWLKGSCLHCCAFDESSWKIFRIFTLLEMKCIHICMINFPQKSSHLSNQALCGSLRKMSAYRFLTEKWLISPTVRVERLVTQSNLPPFSICPLAAVTNLQKYAKNVARTMQLNFCRAPASTTSCKMTQIPIRIRLRIRILHLNLYLIPASASASASMYTDAAQSCNGISAGNTIHWMIYGSTRTRTHTFTGSEAIEFLISQFFWFLFAVWLPTNEYYGLKYPITRQKDSTFHFPFAC